MVQAPGQAKKELPLKITKSPRAELRFLVHPQVDCSLYGGTFCYIVPVDFHDISIHVSRP